MNRAIPRLTYLGNGASLTLDRDSCKNCGACIDVCPHAVFVREDSSVRIDDAEACMECGACALNCPFKAIKVRVGVGCAAAIYNGMIKGGAPDCGCQGGDGACC